MKLKTGTCFSCLKVRLLTAEHIIPQSIGGRLKPRLYCKDCNSAFGTVLDKEISDQFGHIATTLQIRRERGTVQPFTVEDIETKTELLFDGKQLKRKDPIINLELALTVALRQLMLPQGRNQI